MFKIVKEANNKSATILTQAMTSEKFKDNQQARNTLIRANDLFYGLSEAPNNYDVFVEINNDGETSMRFPVANGSENYIQVTVTSPTDKIKTFVGGLLELTDENLNKVQEIIELVKKY